MNIEQLQKNVENAQRDYNDACAESIPFATQKQKIDNDLKCEHLGEKLIRARAELNKATALYGVGDIVFTISGEATILSVSDVADHYTVQLHDRFKTICTRKVLHRVE